MKLNQQNLTVNIIKDRIFFILIAVLAFITVIPLVLILFFIFKNGIQYINWDLLFHLPAPAGEPGGGIVNAILGSFLLVGIASVIALPVGILGGLYLSEHAQGRLASVMRITVDVLQGVPSIVIGIIAYIWFVLPMGGFSGLSGSIALAIMMLPVVIKNTEETLKMVPASLREAAYALGVPYYKVTLRVVLPAGLSGVLTGVLISVARIAGETAPLLFTAFGNPFINMDIFKPVEAVPHVIFKYATSPYTDWQNIAWGASLLLVGFVLILNILAKVVVSKWKVKF